MKTVSDVPRMLRATVIQGDIYDISGGFWVGPSMLLGLPCSTAEADRIITSSGATILPSLLGQDA